MRSGVRETTSVSGPRPLGLVGASCLERAQEHLGWLCSRDAVLAVDDEEGHPIAAECPELTDFLIDVGRVIVTFEYPASSIFGDTYLGGESDKRVRVVENLSFDQLRPKETLMQLCAESMRSGQVCEAVRVEGVYEDVSLKVVLQPFGCGESLYMVVHGADLVDRAADLGSERLLKRFSQTLGMLRMQLEASPHDLDLV